MSTTPYLTGVVHGAIWSVRGAEYNVVGFVAPNDHNGMTTVCPAMDTERIHKCVQDAANGSHAAFCELVDGLSGIVWGVARSYLKNFTDREDVVQSVWLSLTQHLGTIREPQKLPGWLASVTRNECLAVLRRINRPNVVSDPLVVNEDPAAALITSEERFAMQLALADLDDRCRELLSLLSLSQHVSYDHIASLLEIPIGSIGPTRSRCLDKVRRHAAVIALRSN